MDYFKSEHITLQRSQIHPADYNPRQISAEGRKQLKKSIKLYGCIGGIVINKQTGYTIVGGHQKIDILDELNKYPDNDYSIEAEVIDVDAKTEKQLNIALNNPNVGGEWDMDKLAALIPDIDWKDAGLTDYDLNLIGVDYNFQTEEEAVTAQELTDMMQPATEERKAEIDANKAAREALKGEKTQEEKTQHMKDVKEQVRQAASEAAANMDAYVMISFDTYAEKAKFCQGFGYPQETKFIKGEVFMQQIEFEDTEDTESEETEE